MVETCLSRLTEGLEESTEDIKDFFFFFLVDSGCLELATFLEERGIRVGYEGDLIYRSCFFTLASVDSLHIFPAVSF